MKVNIVGCGLSGIVAAIILKEQGHSVEIFETRKHIGGNCFDSLVNDTMVHQYGAHIFHTNDDSVWEFVNRYSKFNNYAHRVRANTHLGTISIPYSKKTEEDLGYSLSDVEITDTIFKEYSERHWGMKWSDIPKSITSRVPKRRDDYDDRYFTDKFQGIPVNGYTAMMQNMLAGITVNLGVPHNEWRRWMDGLWSCDKLIFTGKLEDYFDSCYGPLPYRSLKFMHTTGAKSDRFGWDKCAVINQCNHKPYNRTIDNSVFLNEGGQDTVYTRDYPEEHVPGKNTPIYPKNFGEARKLYMRYSKLAKTQHNVVFLGRLASYKYLDMWMAIKQVFTKLTG